MGLKERLLKQSISKHADVLAQTKALDFDPISTAIPMLNVALSGELEGGLTPGVTMFAGPSKHFKTGFGLACVKAFLDKYDDGVVIFYDSEFGAPKDYWDTFGIDMDRVVHIPVTNVEELTSDIVNQFNGLTEDDHVMVLVDSIGNLPSRKEVKDALTQNEAVDMTKAKANKSFYRNVTGPSNLLKIPVIVINHTYKTLEMYSKDVPSGGSGTVYAPDTLIILGRQQDKNQKEGLKGYHFIMNIYKSRFVKEQSKIPITISFDGGISPWSGMFEIALDGNYLINSGQFYYAEHNEEYKVRGRDAASVDSRLWIDILENTDFTTYVDSKYKLVRGKIINDEKTIRIEETEQIQDEDSFGGT